LKLSASARCKACVIYANMISKVESKSVRMTLFASLLAACSGPTRVVTKATAATPHVHEQIYIPPAEIPIATYNPRAPANLGLDSGGLRLSEFVKAAAQVAHRTEPVIDARAGRAADLMALGTHGIEPPSLELVQYALAREGLVEGDVAVMVGRLPIQANATDDQTIQTALREVLKNPEITTIGIGTHLELNLYFAFVLVAPMVRLEADPFPTTLALGERAPLQFRVRSPGHSPVLYLTDVRGRVSHQDLARTNGDSYRVELRCGDEVGVMRVEIMVSTARGPAVAMNVPVGCGMPPVREFRAPMLTWPERFPASPAQAEQQLFEFINQDRAVAGVGPLKLYPQAVGVARGHSEDMIANHFFGHISPTKGSTADRLRVGGIAAAFWAENVGASSSAAEVHVGLMNSPSHREALLSATAQQVAIGAALGLNEMGVASLYVTELFFDNTATIDRPMTSSTASAGATSPRIVHEEAAVDGCTVRGMTAMDVKPNWEGDDVEKRRVTTEIETALTRQHADTALVTLTSSRGRTRLSVTLFACR